MVLLSASYFRTIASDTTRAVVMTMIMAPIMIMALICRVFKLARHCAKLLTHIIPINPPGSHIITSLISPLRKLRLGNDVMVQMAGSRGQQHGWTLVNSMYLTVT